MVRCEKCRKEAWTRIDDTWLCPKCAAKFDVDKILAEFRATIEDQKAEIADLEASNDALREIANDIKDGSADDYARIAALERELAEARVKELEQELFEERMRKQDAETCHLAVSDDCRKLEQENEMLQTIANNADRAYRELREQLAEANEDMAFLVKYAICRTVHGQATLDDVTRFHKIRAAVVAREE